MRYHRFRIERDAPTQELYGSIVVGIPNGVGDFDTGSISTTEESTIRRCAQCQEKGFTQVELADVFKVSTQWVNDWFTGRKLPTAEKALEIQEWLKTKPKPRRPRKRKSKPE